MSVPDPATTDWVPLWSFGGSTGALPADTLILAATRIIANKLLPGDTQPIYRFFGDGKQEWGPGGVTAPDTNLYRPSPNLLQTDDSIWAVGGIAAALGTASQVWLHSTDGIYFGNTTDTRLYRSAANALTTPGTFTAGGRFYSGAPSTGGIYVNGATASQFFGSYDAANVGIYNGQWWWRFRNDGYMDVGGANDTWIYRGAAANVYVDNTLRVIGSIVVNHGAPQAYLYFGSALDTYLYRRTTSQLGVHGVIVSDSLAYFSFGGANQVTIGDHGRGVPEIQFGPYNDASLYRSSTHWINHYSADGAWGGFNAAIYSVQSDRKTKSEIEPADVPVERLLNTGIYTYERDKWPGRHLGLIADELPDELTNIATTPGGERLQFVDLYKLATALLATVQHLDGRLKALEGGT